MITVFLGENTAERDKAFKTFLANFVSHNGDMAVDFINVEDVIINNIIDSVTTVPFLSNKRLVVIKYLGANKELADKLDMIIDRTSGSTELVIIETTLDNRSIYAKTLKKRADTLNIYESLEGAGLVQWLVNEAKAMGASLSNTDATYLIERVGHNQQLLTSELTKLTLIDAKITRPIINEMTEQSPSSSVFSMLDSVVAGRVDVASKLYDEQRAQGVEPQAIMGMITWQLSILSAIVASHGDSADIIAKRHKLSPFVVRKNNNLAQQLSRAQILNMLDIAIETDENIKTGKLKPVNAVHSLILELANIVKDL